MNIALIARLGSLSPVQNFLRWVDSQVFIARKSAAPQMPVERKAAYFAAPCTSHAMQTTRHRTAPRPLRVVRVVESGDHCHSGGRMVISGCMADVCAELERLAACEATPMR